MVPFPSQDGWTLHTHHQNAVNVERPVRGGVEVLPLVELKSYVVCVNFGVNCDWLKERVFSNAFLLLLLFHCCCWC